MQETPIRYPIKTLVAALLAASAAAEAGAAPTYRIRELGVGPGGYASQGLAINDRNLVVGWIQKRQLGPHFAVVFLPVGPHEIGALPGDVSSYATAVNDAGQVVGYSGDPDSPRAFVWQAGSDISPLGALDPARPWSSATGISNDGTAVGTSRTPEGVFHAFTWTAAGGLVDPFPKRGPTDAEAINSRGKWVGHADGQNRTVGVRVDAAGHVTDLGTIDPSAPYTYGKGLNDRGQVTGYGADPVTLASHAIVWDARIGIRDLGILPGGNFSNGLAINDAGQAVGIADRPGGRGTVDGPFYWDVKTGLVDLATLVDPQDPLYGKVAFDAAQDINNHGVIVANGIVGNDYRAYLLIPED